MCFELEAEPPIEKKPRSIPSPPPSEPGAVAANQEPQTTLSGRATGLVDELAAGALEDLLDDTPFDIATLSRSPEGDTQDGLPATREHLAMVAVNLKTLRQDLPCSDVKMSGRIQEACEQVSDLENDIQALSHRLHSSKLEYLGLEAATASVCRELSERQGAKIDLRCDAIPEDLRLTFKILKNSNCLPIEMELQKEIYNLRQLINAAIDPETRKPRISNITAGLSGPAIKPIALRMVYDLQP